MNLFDVPALGWLAVATIAAILEVSVPHFGSAFVTAGAVAAAAAAYLGYGVTVQFAAFVVVLTASIALLRTRILERIGGPGVPSRTVLLIGRHGVIAHDVDPGEVDAVIYYLIADPVRATYEVQNLPWGLEQLTLSALRNVIGQLDLDHTLSSRDTTNSQLRAALYSATQQWGVKVMRIELKNITPPEEIRLTMEKQMTAERTRRAVVTAAEGDKASAILRAEGQKQAQIVNAEGAKEAAVLAADGQAQARLRVAQAEAQAIQLIAQALDDGGTPLCELIQGRDGNLYGTTAAGGTPSAGGAFFDAVEGTTFKWSLDGTLTTLHTFIGFGITRDAGPEPGLLEAVDGTFYGTSRSGGLAEQGSVFNMRSTGDVSQVLDLYLGLNLRQPAGLAQAIDGNFYGVATGNGAFGQGGIFRIDSTGHATVLKAFEDIPPSNAALIQTSDLHFYGTANNCTTTADCHGYVFRLDALGNLQRIGPALSHLAGPTPAGASALGALVQGRDGSLYGTTRGDTHSPAGTVFRISSFASCDDALSASYTNGTLTLGFTLMTTTPTTWNTWLALAGPPQQSALLWSVPLPAVSPAVSFTLPIPSVPAVGDVFALTALTTPTGVVCADWKVVNTGQPPAPH